MNSGDIINRQNHRRKRRVAGKPYEGILRHQHQAIGVANIGISGDVSGRVASKRRISIVKRRGDNRNNKWRSK